MWMFGSASERVWVCAVIAKTFVAEPSHAVSSFSRKSLPLHVALVEPGGQRSGSLE